MASAIRPSHPAIPSGHPIRVAPACLPRSCCTRTASACATTRWTTSPSCSTARRTAATRSVKTKARVLGQAGAAQAADWPRLAGAWGRPGHPLALKEAFGEPAGRSLCRLALDIGGEAVQEEEPFRIRRQAAGGIPSELLRAAAAAAAKQGEEGDAGMAAIPPMLDAPLEVRLPMNILTRGPSRPSLCLPRWYFVRGTPTHQHGAGSRRTY